jgi:hypothetical protein
MNAKSDFNESDIVDRLRQELHHPIPPSGVDRLMAEAADEIERLRDEWERLTSRLIWLEEDNAKTEAALEAEIERLRAENANLRFVLSMPGMEAIRNALRSSCPSDDPAVVMAWLVRRGVQPHVIDWVMGDGMEPGVDYPEDRMYR